MTMFSSGKDAAKEKWDGARTSSADVQRLFGADDALPISSFTSQLKSLLPSYSNIFVDAPSTSTRKSSSPRSLLKFLTSSVRTESEAALDAISSMKKVALAPQVAKLRAIKSPAEQAIMHEAATISGRAHAKTMRFTQEGMSESKVAAHFEYMCALGGCQRPAYVPVVASGANSLIIHYTTNNHVVGKDEMVLIDAGGEYK